MVEGAPRGCRGFRVSRGRFGFARRRGGAEEAGNSPMRYHFVLALPQALAQNASMNSKQRQTLADLFADPVSGTIRWSALESLLKAVGCRVIDGRGSRVKFERNGVIASFHRPHPE